MKSESEVTETIINTKNYLKESKISRRDILKNFGAAGAFFTAGGIFTSCGGGGSSNASAQDNIDVDVLNFALNLEYLEAEYYLRGFAGRGLAESDRGAGAGAVTGGRKVTFSRGSRIEAYAREITTDEENHVKFLRSALGEAAVPSPSIDFDASFAALGFDPFANENNFLLGAFVFEDVGVTAYNGGAPLITDKTFLGAAASILAVEAYHAGTVRTAIANIGGSTLQTAAAISDARDGVNPGVDKDQGVALDNIVPADQFSLAFSRSTTEVLNIVYLNPNTTPGGFFPQGLNGSIR